MKSFLQGITFWVLLMALSVSLKATTSQSLSTEICYNGIDDNGDGLADSQDPLCKVIFVTTTDDLVDGDITSVENLIATPGEDKNISLREAIAATQSIISRDTFHIIGFDLPDYDPHHFYYQDDGVVGQVSPENIARTVTNDDSSILDLDPDYPYSWWRFEIQVALPALSDNVMIDGYTVRQTQMNTREFGASLNTVLRIEIVGQDAVPLNFYQAQDFDNQIVIRGLVIHGNKAAIQVNSGVKGKIALYGNYLGLDPSGLIEKASTEAVITLNGVNRPFIIGSNLDGNNDNGEVNLLTGANANKSIIRIENSTQIQVNTNYFGVGLKGNNDISGGDGIAIHAIGGNSNIFTRNLMGFGETAFVLEQANNYLIQNNYLGSNPDKTANLPFTATAGICHQCNEIKIDSNVIAHAEIGWRFNKVENSYFQNNELFGHTTYGLALIDEANNSLEQNKNNLIASNSFYNNQIGLLIAPNAKGNTITQNSFYNNDNGIDLSLNDFDADGPTANDPNDQDEGPNQLLNYPEIEVINYTPVTATVQMSLDINDWHINTLDGYRIEFFANSTAENGAGEIYFGYLDVEKDIYDETITLPLPAEVDGAYYLSATTTEIINADFIAIDLKSAFGASSELSPSVPLPKPEICDNGRDDDGDGLIDCADPDCGNYLIAGEIAGDETGCGAFDPELIESIYTPFQDSRESVFYQWQRSTDNRLGWEDIPDATGENYDPPAISQTTYFQRLLKKHACNTWLSSNVIEKKINPSPVAHIITFPDETNAWLCAETDYTFEAEDAGEGAIYNWNFGENAQPATSSGKGPHTVKFTTADASISITPTIELSVEQAGCTDSESVSINLHPILQITEVSVSNPTTCGGADGSIAVRVLGETGACVALSIDGGITYLPDNQLSVNGLSAGAYDLFVRYCEGGCPINAGIATLSDPSNIRANDDYFSGYCPGVLFKGSVIDNDTLEGDPVFSIPVDAVYGRVRIDAKGEFTYTAIANICGTDKFSYQVCDGNTGCCATANVEVSFGDNMPPTLTNLPEDITISPEDEIPPPAEVKSIDNCPTTILELVENSTQDYTDCGKYDYTITRTWTATDQCGNATSHIQTIEIADQTAPDIFRIHTLPNGAKLVAGVTEFASHHWKTVHLPIDFLKNPVIFTQLISNEEATPATIRLRNVQPTQFEIQLQEEAANDGLHQKEQVAWIAIERGNQSEVYQMQVDTISVTHGWTTVNFFKSFANIPLFFANMQTINDGDAGTLRNSSVNWNNAKLRVQEENSISDNSAHNKENTGYLVIDNIENLTNHKGEKIGELGRLQVDNNWSTIQLKSTYHNPVIIANSLSIDDFDPAMVRIKNVTPESFDIRVQEWDYLDGEHGIETVAYIVVEGSLPLESPDFCNLGRDTFNLKNELIALDNTSHFLDISYEEQLGFNGTEQLIHRTWFATDDCGNKGVATQTITCPGIALRAKAVLQGALLNSPEPYLMRDDLRKSGFLPLEEPYTQLAGFEHVGSGGGEFMNTALLDIEGENALVDWVLLELRDIFNKNKIIATAAALLQRDGDIISPKGDSLIVFASAPQGEYLVAIRHRNHLGILGKTAYIFSADNIPFIDFRDAEIASGRNAGAAMENIQSMWAGDLNNDRKVIYQGPGNDIFDIFFHIIEDEENQNYIPNFISSGYTKNDFNLDGKVIFQGPDNDRSILLFNTILAHPANGLFLPNFIIEIDIE